MDGCVAAVHLDEHFALPPVQAREAMMPLIKMELLAEARLFLETECLPEEIDAFRVCAMLVREDPIAHSDVWKGRSTSRFVFRSFRFGGCRAFFQYQMTGDRRTDIIKVGSCKRIPHQRSNPEQQDP